MGKTPKKLPPLVVEVRKGGKVVRTIKIPDPRAKFCESYNELKMCGTVAVPA